MHLKHADASTQALDVDPGNDLEAVVDMKAPQRHLGHEARTLRACTSVHLHQNSRKTRPCCPHGILMLRSRCCPSPK